jgi:predicted RNA binding protein YcfA (HicA-like mRNA interferase family)
MGGSQFVEFARGTNEVADGVLGTFDPTMLQNDIYTLRLEATDAGGNVSLIDREVSVGSDLKLGKRGRHRALVRENQRSAHAYLGGQGQVACLYRGSHAALKKAVGLAQVIPLPRGQSCRPGSCRFEL